MVRLENDGICIFCKTQVITSLEEQDRSVECPKCRKILLFESKAAKRKEMLSNVIYLVSIVAVYSFLLWLDRFFPEGPGTFAWIPRVIIEIFKALFAGTG